MHLSVTFASLSIASLSFTLQCMSYLFKKFLSLCVFIVHLSVTNVYLSLYLYLSLSLCVYWMPLLSIVCLHLSFAFLAYILSLYQISLSVFFLLRTINVLFKGTINKRDDDDEDAIRGGGV